MTDTPDNIVAFPRRPIVVTADSGDTVYLDAEDWSWEYEAGEREKELMALAEKYDKLRIAAVSAAMFIIDKFQDEQSKALDGEAVSVEARPTLRALCEAIDFEQT